MYHTNATISAAAGGSGVLAMTGTNPVFVICTFFALLALSMAVLRILPRWGRRPRRA